MEDGFIEESTPACRLWRFRVKQSQAFTDVDDDTKNEMFQRYEKMRTEYERDLESRKGWIGSFKYRQNISALKIKRALHPDDKET